MTNVVLKPIMKEYKKVKELKMHLLPEKVMVRQFIMNNIPMIIMAAGLSSRMKDSSVPKAI